ncbi:MAG: hypothetical protein ACLQPH_18725 [Acidimicrobiales bacterium]
MAYLKERVIDELEYLDGYQSSTFLNNGQGQGIWEFTFNTGQQAREAVNKLSEQAGPGATLLGVFGIEF